MAVVKHQLILFSRDLFLDKYIYDSFAECFKSNLLLANFVSQQEKAERPSLAIFSVDLESYEIFPILSPLVPSTIVMPEVFAAIETLGLDSAKGQSDGDDANGEKNRLIEWTNFKQNLSPHVNYPAQEGYEVLLIVNDEQTCVKNFSQQADCLAFKLVRMNDVIRPKKSDVIASTSLCVAKPSKGLLVITLPSMTAALDSFFKGYVFDDVLCPKIPIILHFSTSIYSKLIISCQARPTNLDFNSMEHTLGWTKADSHRLVLETVARIPMDTGFCQSLMGGSSGSPNFIISPREGTKHSSPNEKQENQYRFLMLVRLLHQDDQALLVQCCTSIERGSKAKITKRYFGLFPSLESQHFCMIQMTPFEMLVPEVRTAADGEEEINLDEESREHIESETKAALKKIPQRDYYDPYDYPCGLARALEAKKTKNSTSAQSKGAPRPRPTAARKSPKKTATKKFRPPIKEKKFHPVATVTKK